MDTAALIAGNKDIPSLLLPIVDYQLIVPTVTVAEMMPYREPVLKDGVDWYIGDLPWRGLMVPVVSFEALLGQPLGDIQPNSQLAVFNNTGLHKDLPFFAMVTQGIPRLSRITNSDIQQIKEPEPPYCKMIVTLDGERALLPDVTAVEKKCCQYLGLQF